jgi:hypothetical protein
MKLFMPPAPREPDEKEAERAGAQSWVEGAEQKDNAEGSYRGARHRAPGANHVACDHLIGRLVRVVLGPKELVAGVTTRAAHDARAKRRSTNYDRRPGNKCPGVRAKRREAPAVTLRKLRARGPVPSALLPPLSPGRSSGVSDFHRRVVANEPSVIVQSPYEVDVFADSK